MTYLITIPGTHGIVDAGGWWKPDSRWWKAAEAHGFQHPCKEDPFFWDTDLEGTLGENFGWMAAGAALRWYMENLERFRHWQKRRNQMANTIFSPEPGMQWIIAFSHGGQVAAYCLSSGCTGPICLITVGTPVRPEMKSVYKSASEVAVKWYHIHSDEADIWQAAGSLGGPGWWEEPFTREMPYAENIAAPGFAHHMLAVPEIWESKGWWELRK